MRFSFVGFVFLVILPASLAMAQLSGTVDSVGFDNHYRPDCWTPMLVTITPQTGRTDSYQIHVKLQDLDRDLPIFTRTISVTGASEGQNRQQQFRMYFMPPPTDGGLPDARDAGVTIKDLQDRLKVSLYDKTGRKWICDLPITTSIINVDPKPGVYDPDRRGRKLIIAVSDGRSRAIYQDNTSSGVMGVLEDVAMVTVHPRDLPENVLGYDAVDAIVWLDADPAQLKAGGDEKFRALESYVRRGGRLVICQSGDWQKILALGDLLPVTIQGVEDKDDLMPLRAMAQAPQTMWQFVEPSSPQRDPFAFLKPPFRFARATAMPDAVVDEWITWKTAGDVSPYLVRRPVELGSVAWVAQDLGDPALTRTRTGWIYVWNRIFDWKNTPLVLTNTTPDSARQPYEQGLTMDLGKSLLGGMDLQSKSLGLITLAILFFIGYWLVAGPGMHAWLASKRRTHLSWFLFGASAVAATALTGLIVKLVLRGPPELAHFSVVRAAPAGPAVVISRFGLYIPRDGMQKIQLRDGAPDAVSSISALPIHPYYLSKAPDENGPEYEVPIVDAASAASASVSVPYRSTLKKFQATWVGDVQGTVQGSAKLTAQDFIDGQLTNDTGHTLRNVYIAFNYPAAGALGGDWILYLPGWNSGSTLDLAREFNKTDDGSARLLPGFSEQNRPTGQKKIRGRITLDWEPYWLGNTGISVMNDAFDDSSSSLRRSLPMLSFFDRLTPSRNSNVRRQPDRLELLRRGARWLDMSQSLAAGSLVVLGEADGPIPMPVEVEGDRVTGNGTIFYQCVLPLDHSAVASTTQPSEPP